MPTEGINIDDWHIQGRKGADGKFERVNVHVWDFGGQEIMHATHQFFLTRRSLYLLVIDARAGEKESNIHYWLKIIQSYGGDSPVLVVVNKCDQHPHELNETRLMRDYPNIRGFIQTSCSTGQGIEKLRREIGKHVRRLPHVFDELPESYFTVKAELEQVAAERNYIPIEDYRKICARHTRQEGREPGPPDPLPARFGRRAELPGPRRPLRPERSLRSQSGMGDGRCLCHRQRQGTEGEAGRSADS